MPADVFARTPNDRIYIHRSCDGATVVGEDDYSGLCNPLLNALGTLCIHCNRTVGLDEVYWRDTGEKLKDYRARLLRDHTPPMAKFFSRVLVPAVLLGIVFLIFRTTGGLIWTSVAFVILFLFWHAAVPRLTARLFKLDFRRFI